jgi:hypothetical protein
MAKLGLGGLALMGILGIRELIQRQDAIPGRQAEGQVSKATRTGPEISPQASLPAPKRYSEWASGIHLPKVEIDLQANPLSIAEAESRFLDPGINRRQVDLFRRFFYESKSEFDWKMRGKENLVDRQELLVKFVSDLIRARCLVFGERDPRLMTFGSPEMELHMGKVNDLLIPSGQRIATRSPFAGQGLKVVISDVRKILPIVVDGKTLKEVMVVLGDRKSYFVDPKKEEDGLLVAGEYKDGERYLTIDPEAGRKIVREAAVALGYPDDDAALAKVMEENRVSMAKHEVMHILMAKEHGVVGLVERYAKRRGKVNLGAYDLAESSYRWADSLQIHELASIGLGIMDSGESAKLNLLLTTFNSEKNYNFVSVIAAYELMNSKYTTPETKKALDLALSGKPMGRREITAILREVPNEEIRRIGELMAKLAIHLTQDQ